ncbi:hypothetical protein J6590_074492 [Homalodisca vitripennis]|nr:hypothetical protein J6590_074487 [Homalodisca vitripennis]KAG8280706.1 hypothetical protein J6590_074492 [Homalodisca vitripennis]
MGCKQRHYVPTIMVPGSAGVYPMEYSQFAYYVMLPTNVQWGPNVPPGTDFSQPQSRSFPIRPLPPPKSPNHPTSYSPQNATNPPERSLTRPRSDEDTSDNNPFPSGPLNHHANMEPPH